MAVDPYRFTTPRPSGRRTAVASLLCGLLLSALAAAVHADPAVLEPASVTTGQTQDVRITIPLQPGQQAYLRPGGLYLDRRLSLSGLQSSEGPAEPAAAALAATDRLALVARTGGGLLVVQLAAEGWRLIGELDNGRPYTRAVIRQDRAYLVAGKRLDLVRLEKPHKPRVIGSFNARVPVVDLAVADGLAALLSERKVLLVDVKRPKRMRIRGRLDLSFAARALALQGDRLFLAAGEQGLLVVDVAEPHNPRVLSQYASTGPVWDVAVRDELLLLACGPRGITLLDASDPAHPRWLGSHQQLGTVRRVHFLEGGRALAVNARNQLFLLDVGSPGMPSLSAALPLDAPLADLAVTAAGPLLLLPDALATLRLDSHPPQLSNEGLDFGQGVNYGGQRRLALRGHLAYVADWFSGIHLYDLSDPRRPRLLSSLHTPGSPKGIVLHGDYAYVADDDHGLQVVDIQDPRRPRLVGRLETPGLAYTPVIAGDYLYLASHRGGFQIIDLFDPAAPELVTSIDTPGKAWSIQVQRDIAYVADDEAGLLIYDVLDPQAPRLLGRFTPGTAAEDVIIDGNIAYVAFFDDGLYVLDVSDPEQPRAVAHLRTPGNARGLYKSGRHLLLADWLAGVHIVDISSPYRARIVGSFDTRGAAWGVALMGRHAVVADWWGGLVVLDVSRPARPRLAGRYLRGAPVFQVATRGRYAYAAKGDDGLQVFDIDNPLNPTWITGVDLPAVRAVVLGEDHAYLPQATGLAVVDIRNPFESRLAGHLELGHAVQVLRRRGTTLYAAGGRDLSRVQLPSGSIERFTQPAAVRDLWAAEERLWVLGDDGRIRGYRARATRPDIVYQPDLPDPRLLRARGAALYVAGGRTIEVLRRAGDRLIAAERLAVPGTILDLQVDGERLFALTAGNRIYVYARHETHWRPLTEYRTLGDIRTLTPHGEILYLGGSAQLIALQQLPAPAAAGTRLSLPAGLPPGHYDLVIRESDGRLGAEYADALTVTLPRFSGPRFTMDDLEQALRRRQAAPSPTPLP